MRQLLRCVKSASRLCVESNNPDCAWRATSPIVRGGQTNPSCSSANKPSLFLPQQTQLVPPSTNPICSSLPSFSSLTLFSLFRSVSFSLSLSLSLSLQFTLLLPPVIRATTHCNTLQHIKQVVVAPGWHMTYATHMAYVSTSHTCVYVDEVCMYSSVTLSPLSLFIFINCHSLTVFTLHVTLSV